ELDVTPRALYNHVRDRQEVIDLTAGVMLGALPMPTFDAEDWRDALREAYREAREVYRQHPRALLISLDETITPGEVPLERFALTETMLAFFTSLGLRLEQAMAFRSAF